MRLKKAFTLIELLVVVAIILIISSIIFVSFENAQKKSRDAKRKSDLTTIQTALEMYYREKGEYPKGSSTITQNSRVELSDLGLGDYLSTIPQDPKNSCLNPGLNSKWALDPNCFTYSYIIDPKGQKYLLWANLETKSGNGEDFTLVVGPYANGIDEPLGASYSQDRASMIYIVEKH